MTWEERCKMLRDSKPDCIVEMEVSERNLADSEQEALKAFADELVKRIDEHQFWTNTDPTGEMELRAMDVKVYINQLLTEAGAKE